MEKLGVYQARGLLCAWLLDLDPVLRCRISTASVAIIKDERNGLQWIGRVALLPGETNDGFPDGPAGLPICYELGAVYETI